MDGSLFEGLGTVAAAFVGAFALWWTTHQVEKGKAAREKEARTEEADRQARYVAMRAVVILDRFVSECCETVLDDGMPDGRYGETTPRTPNPSIDLPADIDWRWLPADFMYRTLALPQDVQAAEDSITFIWQHVANGPDYEEVFEERIIQFARIGFGAHRLARDLREFYNIPPRRNEGFSAGNALDNALSAQERKRAEREKERIRFNEELAARAAALKPSS